MPSPCRPIHAFLVLALAGLVACGGADEPDEVEVVFQPESIALRPGEDERVRIESDGDLGLAIVDDADWADVDPFAAEDCLPPADRPCALERIEDDPAVDHDRDGRFTFLGAPRAAYAPVVGHPEQTPAAPPAVRFAAGGDGGTGVSVAIDALGRAWAWGNVGSPGQGGDLHWAVPRQLAAPADGARLVAVDVGTSEFNAPYFLALDEQGRVWAWGQPVPPIEGPATSDFLVPRLLPGLDRIIAVSAGGAHGMALRDDGSVWTWGTNTSGQLGRGNGADPAPAPLDGARRYRAIAAGNEHSMALDSNGAVWVWGDNDFGQSARGGESPPRIVYSPIRVDPSLSLTDVTAIDAGVDFSLALRRNGRVVSWGRNDRNQLGRASGEPCSSGLCNAVPGFVEAPFADVQGIAAGGDFALALRRDGSVWAWGSNLRGQLTGVPGLGSIVPLRVDTGGPALAVVAGAYHAMVLRTADACPAGDGRTGGRLLAWGDNLAGERGDGTALNHVGLTPVLALGDDERCAQALGRRVFMTLSGTQGGSVASSVEGLQCSRTLCWQTVADGTALTLTATPDDPAIDPEWRWDCADAGRERQAVVRADRVRHCKALFSPPAPTRLSVTVLGNGSVRSEPAGIDCTDRCSAAFEQGQVVVLTPEPAEGWRFVSFGPGGDADCDDGRVTMQARRRCVATFEPIEPIEPPGGFTLSLTVGAGGRVTSVPAGIDCRQADCSALYPAGTIVQLTALPDAGYRFVGFGGDALCANPSFVLSADLNCTATFEAVPGGGGNLLTVQRTGGAAAQGRVIEVQPGAGIDCGADCSEPYAAGTLVVLEASVLAPDVFFSHWTGCEDTGESAAGAPQCFVRMDQARTVQADFQ